VTSAASRTIARMALLFGGAQLCTQEPLQNDGSPSWLHDSRQHSGASSNKITPEGPLDTGTRTTAGFAISTGNR
jgi:hypothetical protein